MTWRLTYGAVCTLVLAGIVHIAIVLLIPVYGTRDAYAVLAGKTDEWAFAPLETEAAKSPLADVDPFFAYGVCRFDLSADGTWITGKAIDSFWSATVLNADGTVLYSLNSRTSIGGQLSLVLLDPLQTLRLREAQPAEIENAIVVEAETTKGFIVVRALQPDASWRTEINKFMESVDCRRYRPEIEPVSDEGNTDG